MNVVGVPSGNIPPQASGIGAAGTATGVASSDKVKVTVPPGASRAEQIKCIQQALCKAYGNANVGGPINTGAFADLISSILPPTKEISGAELSLVASRVASRLSWLIDSVAKRSSNSPEVAASLIGKFQVQLVTKMLAANYGEEKVSDTLVGLEAQAKILNVSCQFENLGLTMPLIRQWLSDVVNAQLNTTRSFPWTHSDAPVIIVKAGTDIIPQIKIGLDQFDALLKAKHVGKITKAAMDFLFGNQNRTYEADKDVLSLDKFTAEVRDRVFVYAGMISGNALLKMLQLFSADRFVLLSNQKMSDGIKRTMMHEIRKNIWADPTLTSDTARAEALKIAQGYLNAGDIEKLAENLIKDANGKPTSYLGDYSRSALVTFLRRASNLVQKKMDNPDAPATPPVFPDDVEYMYAMGGFASLLSTANEAVLGHLLTAKGEESELMQQKGWLPFLMPGIEYGVNEVDEMTVRFAAEQALYGDSGRFSYRPEIVDYRDRVAALRDTGAVKKNIERLRAEEEAEALSDASVLAQATTAIPVPGTAPSVPQTPPATVPAQPVPEAPSTPPATAPGAPSIVAPPAKTAPTSTGPSPADQARIIADDMRRFNNEVSQNNIPQASQSFSGIMFEEIGFIQRNTPLASMKKLTETSMIQTLNSAEWTPERITSLMNEAVKQANYVQPVADALYALKLLNPAKAEAVIGGLAANRKPMVIALIAGREKSA